MDCWKLSWRVVESVPDRPVDWGCGRIQKDRRLSGAGSSERNESVTDEMSMCNALGDISRPCSDGEQRSDWHVAGMLWSARKRDGQC